MSGSAVAQAYVHPPMPSVVLGILLAAIVNCAPSQPPRAAVTQPSPSARPIEIAQPPPSERPTEPVEARLRTACATRVLTELADAINARDAAALGRIVASGPSSNHTFQWVSITAGGIHETAYTPERARRMLLDRAASGERWTLGGVTASEGPSWHGGVDAWLRLERQSADARVARMSGKTALSCLSSTIFVLGLGDD